MTDNNEEIELEIEELSNEEIQQTIAAMREQGVSEETIDEFINLIQGHN
ncbi:MAG TPA: hypothetical protein V6D10_22640 [Trichocoleus sp.]|jgi:DNA-binding transcriptional regulator YhcF (GntR family)